jgi:hypothetical protein
LVLWELKPALLGLNVGNLIKYSSLSWLEKAHVGVLLMSR